MDRELILGFVPYGTGTHKPFDAVYKKARNVTPEMIYGGAVDALVIWGGADISPSLYHQKPSLYTGAEERLSHRDKVEVAVCEAAIKSGVPIIGVCRGAQLLCALAGGELIQHVTNHHSDHEITTDDGRTIITTSVHHQMLFPWNVEHKLIAWSSERRSSAYYGDDTKPVEKAFEHPEPEIVYFPKIKGLAIQGHPEFMHRDEPFVKYCNTLVEKYLVNEEVTA